MSDILGRIEEIKRNGAWVRLSNKRRAWLSANEVFADFKIHDDLRRKSKLYVGLELMFRLIGESWYQGNRELAVSRIRIENDPWDEVVNWKDGDIKVVEIQGVTPRRAMGIIKPGIRAEILLEGIAHVVPSRWLEFAMPLPGDEVAGYFCKTELNEKKRVVTLDYVRYLKGKVAVSDCLLEKPISKELLNAASHYSQHSQEELSFQSLSIRNVRSILLVDDEVAILRLGDIPIEDFEVHACGTAAEAEIVIRDTERRIDLAILDLHLTEKRLDIFDGLDIGRLLKDIRPSCPIVLITGAQVDDSLRFAINNCGFIINDLIFKPFGFGEFIRALLASRCAQNWNLEIQDNPVTSAIGHGEVEEHGNEKHLATLLDSVKQATNAEGVILFSIDPVAYSVQIVGHAGDTLKYGQHKLKLDRSPVRDSAIDGEEIFTARSTSPENIAKHRWLQKAYHYESCIGVPVRTRMAHNLAYCLFSFHSKPGHFNSSDVSVMRLGAFGCREMLFQRTLVEELFNVRPFELMGKLYATMAHDLMEGLSFDFIIKSIRSSIESSNRNKALEDLDDLDQQSKRSQEIVKSFRSMAQQQHNKNEDVLIYKTISSIVTNFNSQIRHRTKITLLPRSSCETIVSMRKVGLEQLIYNICLNATEQISRSDFRSKNYEGEVVVEYLVDSSRDDVIRSIVRIYDNGPGIHRKDFKTIFDLHFSTKEEGCGLGLDICRRIATSVRMGELTGHVHVKRSIVLGGTEFEIILPVTRLLKDER